MTKLVCQTNTKDYHQIVDGWNGDGRIQTRWRDGSLDDGVAISWKLYGVAPLTEYPPCEFGCTNPLFGRPPYLLYSPL